MSTGPHMTVHSAMDLIDAVEDGQLFLDYQPVWCLETGEVKGVEALVRWDHPIKGKLGPSEFLPQAQRSRLGGLITAFVLKSAALQWMAWRDAGVEVGLAVNVPPLELRDSTVECLVRQLVAEGLDPTALTIEVTERYIADACEIQKTLGLLHDLGVRLSIDDFGTGDSSLVRLQDLAFDEIKIDRCFVAGISDSAIGAGRQIVRFATELAHSLDMSVVAEGVEEADQLEPLRLYDVDLVQGYHLGRPGTADIVRDLVLGV